MFTYLMEHNRYLNIVGIIIIIITALLFSKNRRAINIRLVLSALALHFAIAYIMIVNNFGRVVIGSIASSVAKLSIFADAGSNFVFGELANSNQPWGFIFAIKALPLIVFIGALTAILFHWGIIQAVVSGINKVISPLVGASGIETMAAIANSILGQTEAALFMSSYLPLMTQSELFVLMTSGMAAISITVLIIYTVLGIPSMHLLAASIMSIPASLFIAKMIIPEEDMVALADRKPMDHQERTTNIFDAISKGTFEGLQLGVSVIAMLLSFLALLSMSDYLFGLVSYFANILLQYAHISFRFPEFSLALVLSYIFAPFAYLMGLEGQELWDAGKLLGIKVSVNELVAFSQLVKYKFSDRNFIIVLYSLCGFSNLSCIGIQIGMIGALAPKQRPTITQLGLLAVLASSLANLLSAMIVGLLI